MRIYFAGPLFSEAEKRFNLALAERIEAIGFQVFLPQRDGVERNKSPYGEMSDEERREAMFNFDRDKILEADIFLFVLDGRVPDEGACVELGIAYGANCLMGAKKIIIGIQTDVRAAFLRSKINPMIKVPLQYVADSEDALIVYLEALKGGLS